MNDMMRRAVEYLDRAAFGVELWRFPANNPRAKEETRKAAERHVGGGRTVVLVPVMPGEQSDLYGVDHIEPGLAGIDALLRVIKDFYEEKIKRVIVGQTLTSEAQSTGLGSGVANAHLATFHDIISYDARNLEETITKDYLRPLQLWNFPGFDHIYLKFSIDTESDNVQERLQAYRQAWEMGMGIKTDDIAAAIGVSVPQHDESFVCNPQLYAAIQQFSGSMSIMGPAIQPASQLSSAMAQNFQQAISNAIGVAA
jgi:phage gp29-like protein